MLVPDNLFWPSLIFASKARAYLNGAPYSTPSMLGLSEDFGRDERSSLISPAI
jgi:hypothetical protein